MSALAQMPLPAPWDVVVPAGLTALAAVLLVLLGWGLGRRVRERGPRRDVLAALEGLAEGQLDVALRAAPDDPDAALVRAIEQLADAMARRERDPGRRRALRLAAALDALDDEALLVVDADFAVTAASGGAVARLAGDGPLEGRGLDDLFDADELAAFLAQLARVRREGGTATARLALAGTGDGAPARVDVVARWVDGERPALVMRLVPAPDPARDPALVAARLRALVDGLGAGVLIVEDGRVVEANRAALGMLGEQAVGRRLGDLVAAEDLLLVLDRVARAARGETVPPFRCRVGLGGAEPPASVEAEAIAVPSAEGRPAVALGLRPLGAEADAGAVIRMREARLLGVLDALDDGIALLVERPGSPHPWRVALVNRAFERIVGIDSSEVLGAALDEFAALVASRLREPEAFSDFASDLDEQDDAGRRERFELAHGAGRVEATLGPVRGPAGRPLGRLLVLRPCDEDAAAPAAPRAEASSDLEQAYEELVAVHRDLAARTEELSRLNRELEELDRFRARLLGEAAHELQSPLVSVRGYTQMLLDGRLGRLNEEQRKGLEATLRNVDRMAELIGNLLALARAESAGDAETVAVDAGRAVEEAVTRHEGAARARGVRLEARVDEPGATISADPEDLRRVLDNLVGNAVKFTPRGGRVSVGLVPGPRGYVELVVEDTGIGIPGDERDKVFEPFFRGRGARDAPGTGLGLAMVRRIVERHGASIELDSRVGQGTRFVVRWPRAGSGVASRDGRSGANTA
ncbi:MAG: hypothetical protein Kow0062_27750 [Acidobacteriota bacterium]